MPSIEQGTAGIAGILCLASVSWLILSQSEVMWPGKIRTNLPPLQLLEATQPDIGPLERFKKEQNNPFIPLLDREAEVKAISAQKTPQPAQPQPQPIEAPKAKEYPPLPPDDAPDQPTLLGVVRKGDDAWAWLTVPGNSEIHQVKLGGSVSGWTLKALDGISGATIERDGHQQELTISPMDDVAHVDHHASHSAPGGGPPAEIQIAGLTVRPGSRRNSVWINGQDWPLSDILAGRVPGVSIGLAGPDQLLVNGQPISMEALRPFGFNQSAVNKSLGGGAPPNMDRYRGRRPGPSGPPTDNLPPWMRPGGGPPPGVPPGMPPNQPPR